MIIKLIQNFRETYNMFNNFDDGGCLGCSPQQSR